MSPSLQEAYIILVEDDPNAQIITLDLLRLGGASHCYSRKTVNDALALAETLPRVDLFLVDINMPVRSGYELLAEARQRERLQQAKVVAVTAGTLDADFEKAQQLGFDGFLSKPLKPAEFTQQVQRILAGESIWDRR